MNFIIKLFGLIIWPFLHPLETGKFLLSAFDVRDIAHGENGNENLLKRIIAAMILAVITAYTTHWTGIEWITPSILDLTAIGTTMFLKPIFFALPFLIFCAVAQGIAENEISTLKGIGSSTLLYFGCTTVISVATGATIMMMVNPAQYASPELIATVQNMAQNITPVTTGSTEGTRSIFTNFAAGIDNIIPTNLAKEILETNFLQILLIAVLAGIFLLTSKEKLKATKHEQRVHSLIDWLDIANLGILWVVKLAMGFAPIAVISIIGGVLYETGIEALTSLAIYSLAIVTIMVAHITGFFSLALMFVAKLNPIKAFKQIKGLITVGAATSSSSAVMPLAIETAEKRGVSKLVSKFVVTLGATINMDGTAAYQAAAAIFLLYLFGIEPTFAIVAGIAFQATVASIGTPGAPGVGLIILGGILAKHGVPVEALAIIMPVDRLLEMVRTGVNIYGDQVAASVMNRFYGDPQKEEPKPFTQEDIQSQELVSTAKSMVDYNHKLNQSEK